MIEHGLFLAWWLNRLEAGGFKDAMDRIQQAFLRRPLPRDYFKKAAQRPKGDAEAPDPDSLAAEARTFLIKSFPDETFLYWLCAFSLGVEDSRRTALKDHEYALPGLGDAQTWRNFLGIIAGQIHGAEKLVQSGAIRLRLSDWRLDFDAVCKRGDDGHILFDLEPRNDGGRAILALAYLIGSGDAHRVRRCRGCGRFLFAWPRADRVDCSQRCKMAYWYHTPQGRASRAVSMQKYRANLREKERNQRLTGKDLKKSESILATLGKRG